MALPNADFGAVFACISFAYNSNASKQVSPAPAAFHIAPPVSALQTPAPA